VSIIPRTVMSWPVAVKWSLVSRCVMLVLLAAGAESSSGQLRFERKPIEYSKTPANDPVALLGNKLERGGDSLRDEPKYGYLVSLLTDLKIPVSSQTLVFSKTSLQRHLVSSSNPRAIYFNDDTYIGWIPNGELIEVASIDSMLGSVFYTVDQKQGKQAGKIVRRTERCLFCHASSNSGRVPGLLMQSVYTNPDGNRVFPSVSIPTNPRGPLRGRWSGWFVTGTHGNQQHLGNLMIDSTTTLTLADTVENSNVVDLSRWFDVTKYLSPHSDIVALLVLQHQVSFHNLLTDANHRARAYLYHAATDNRDDGRAEGRLSEEDSLFLDQIAEQIVDGLLMVGEAQFREPIRGTSEFANEFAKRGPYDLTGRSLRQFDLQTSLFRYPCSYLIYSESFNALPEPVLALTYQRLFDVLRSKDTREKYARVTAAQRSAIYQILCDTKANLPAQWKRPQP
jgi:hypothetical protein